MRWNLAILQLSTQAIQFQPFVKPILKRYKDDVCKKLLKTTILGSSYNWWSSCHTHNEGKSWLWMLLVPRSCENQIFFSAWLYGRFQPIHNFFWAPWRKSFLCLQLNVGVHLPARWRVVYQPMAYCPLHFIIEMKLFNIVWERQDLWCGFFHAKVSVLYHFYL